MTFAIRHPHQKSADQPRALRNSDGIEVTQCELRSFESFADHRDDLPQMLARSKFGHHAAILAVNINLRRNDARKDASSVADNRSGGFVARRLDAENVIFFRLSYVRLAGALSLCEILC